MTPNAQITGANLNYMGSIVIDPELMELIGLREYEKVAVWNITNGSRIETYVMCGTPGSREVVINGGTAHLMHERDRVVIAYFGALSNESWEPIPEPRIVVLGEANALRVVPPIKR